jgi:hypothetical protein
VTVGFEPDLVFFSATNGARTDSATDRTAGWSRGVGWSGGDDITNYSLTAADDAQTTDQATCAADDDTALQLLRHSSDRPPGRIQITLAETTSDGFEVDVQVPGNDPFASGIRVHYQAIRTASETEVGVDTFTTPTEPGTQVVDLDVTADHVSLFGSAAVGEAGRLWTTDRGVSLSTGHAVVEDDRVEQAVWGASAWPRSGHDSAAVTTEDGLNLLYQDGDALAGRTRATVADIGSELRLRYDRVYNGPHKLGSTARHVVAYLGMAGGDAMRPAVGAVPMPRQGEKLQVDCGFEPAMVEVTVSGAPLGEEVPNWAVPQPFGYSEGTAISDDEGLRQYVLHHAFTPAPQASTAAVDTEGQAAATDAGASTDGGQPAPDPGSGSRGDQPVPNDDLATTGDVAPETLRIDRAAQSPEPEGDEGSHRVRHPSDVPDDGIVGISMLHDSEGTVLGRDECRVTGMTPYGFDVTTGRVAADDAPAPANRPTLVYRAWPAVDGREGYSQHSADSAQTQDGGQQSQQSDQSASTDTGSPGTRGSIGTVGGSEQADEDNMTGANIDTGSQPAHDLQKQMTETSETEGRNR